MFVNALLLWTVSLFLSIVTLPLEVGASFNSSCVIPSPGGGPQQL